MKIKDSNTRLLLSRYVAMKLVMELAPHESYKNFNWFGPVYGLDQISFAYWVEHHFIPTIFHNDHFFRIRNR